MKDREISHIPDRLINEPVVFKGMSDTEVVTLIVSGIVFWIPVCVLILSFFGIGIFGVGVGLGMAILTMLIAGKKLQIMKRKMPDGMHIVYLKKMLQRKISGMSFGYIDSSGPWDIRRTKRLKKIK